MLGLSIRFYNGDQILNNDTVKEITSAAARICEYDMMVDERKQVCCMDERKI